VYVKASSRKTRDGQVIRYLQLAHNEWDPAAGVSRTKILRVPKTSASWDDQRLWR
jgi:hypothetical protein